MTRLCTWSLLQMELSSSTRAQTTPHAGRASSLPGSRTPRQPRLETHSLTSFPDLHPVCVLLPDLHPVCVPFPDPHPVYFSNTLLHGERRGERKEGRREGRRDGRGREEGRKEGREEGREGGRGRRRESMRSLRQGYHYLIS